MKQHNLNKFTITLSEKQKGEHLVEDLMAIAIEDERSFTYEIVEAIRHFIKDRS